MQRKEFKKESFVQLFIAFIVIISVVVIGHFVFARIDITADKRYTLSEHTKQMLKEANDIVYFKIYLDGDLPAGFKRLQNATREILDEFRVYGRENIQYDFIDPAESSDRKTRNEVFKQLYEKGLEPTNLQVKEKDGASSQKIIFPGIIISYRGQEIAVSLLKNYVGYSPEGNLMASIQSLEYEISYAMHKLTSTSAPKIAFLDDHGELPTLDVDDIAKTLSDFYELHRVSLNEYLYSLRDTLGRNKYDLVIIAKPQLEFSEKDKFIIDQYVMNGGKIFWLIDNVKVDLDSLAYSRSTMALNNSLNLDDMLFKYGVRLNYNLIQDMQCAVIPVNTALVGQQPKFTPAPWVYFPLLSPVNEHPLSKNLDLIKSQFVNVIDTVGEDPAIVKSILLTSSKYSRAVIAPALIDLSMINERQDPARFTKPFLPVGVLLEGTFKSVFTNRVSPLIAKNNEIGLIETSKPTKMIVISDGDIIRNLSQQNGDKMEALPLGYDRFTRQTFGNKELVLNCINYLSDNEGLMEARAKEFKLRMLDRPKIMEQRLKWQLINMVTPIFMVFLLGAGYNFYRKRKFAN